LIKVNTPPKTIPKIKREVEILVLPLTKSRLEIPNNQKAPLTIAKYNLVDFPNSIMLWDMEISISL